MARNRYAQRIVAVAALLSGGAALAEPQSFPTPDTAVAAVVAAIEARDPEALLVVFGPENKDVVFTGDTDKDKKTWGRFIDDYTIANRIDTSDPERAVLHIGRDDWPFPADIVKVGNSWAFDATGAREEVRLRRIGLNELDVIDLLRSGVEVQRAYRSVDYDGDGVMEFASSILSSPGERDGLYWPEAEGAPRSPIGAFLAKASADGFSVGDEIEPADPYLGYYYRILTRQGPDAPGGAQSYLINGNMVGGFAILAYPADYDQSGIMTFVVGENGVVYQSDLGPDTIAVGNEIITYNPGPGWEPASD